MCTLVKCRKWSIVVLIKQVRKGFRTRQRWCAFPFDVIIVIFDVLKQKAETTNKTRCRNLEINLALLCSISLPTSVQKLCHRKSSQESLHWRGFAFFCYCFHSGDGTLINIFYSIFSLVVPNIIDSRIILMANNLRHLASVHSMSSSEFCWHSTMLRQTTDILRFIEFQLLFFSEYSKVFLFTTN